MWSQFYKKNQYRYIRESREFDRLNFTETPATSHTITENREKSAVNPKTVISNKTIQNNFPLKTVSLIPYTNPIFTSDQHILQYNSTETRIHHSKPSEINSVIITIPNSQPTPAPQTTEASSNPSTRTAIQSAIVNAADHQSSSSTPISSTAIQSVNTADHHRSSNTHWVRAPQSSPLTLPIIIFHQTHRVPVPQSSPSTPSIQNHHHTQSTSTNTTKQYFNAMSSSRNLS